MAAGSGATRATSAGQRGGRDRSKTGPTSKRPPTKKPDRRYGNAVPRVFTPPLRELTPETSLGFAVIEFADEMLLIELLPWQKWLLIHMLELLPDDSLRFRTVVVLVARQNGKSTLSQVLALWFMYCYGLSLVLGTAQDLDTAEEVWEGAVNLVTEVDDETDEAVRPELAEMVEKVVQVNGKKALVLKTGKRYKVKAANRRAGRGLSGELILLDELREHQSWDAWGSITKTTMAKAVALILALSNAGDSTSVVLRHLRKLAHARIGDPDGINAADDEQPGGDAPTAEELEDFDDDAADLLDDLEQDDDDDSLGIFEWSAAPHRDKRDREGWAEANPSLGYTIFERNLVAAVNTDPDHVFNAECLCRWPGGTIGGPFPPGTWDAGRWDPNRGEPPRMVGVRMACVAMSHDRLNTTIEVAGLRQSGIPQVEVVASRPGSGWVRGWFLERWGKFEQITGLRGGPEGQLVKALQEPVTDAESVLYDVRQGEKLPVTEWAGENVSGWAGLFYDLVKETTADEAGTVLTGLAHLPQPPLDIAAGNAVTKPMGMRFMWDLAKSSVDVSTLIGATGAVGLLMTHTTKAPPPAPESVRPTPNLRGTTTQLGGLPPGGRLGPRRPGF